MAGVSGPETFKKISELFSKFEVSTSELLQNNKYINTYKFKFFLNKGVPLQRRDGISLGGSAGSENGTSPCATALRVDCVDCFER